MISCEIGTKSLLLQNLPENCPAFKSSSVSKHSSGSCLSIYDYTEIKNCKQLIRLFTFMCQFDSNYIGL